MDVGYSIVCYSFVYSRQINFSKQHNIIWLIFENVYVGCLRGVRVFIYTGLGV
jgi:hypothetical protein